MENRTGGKARNRKWIYLVILVLVALILYKGPGAGLLSGDGGSGSSGGGAGSSQSGIEQQVTIQENGSYDSKDEVALYLFTFKRLPSNYITKSEARDLGWEGGSLEDVAPGKCLGGDGFGNRERALPKGNGISYKECDIGTLGQKERGPERLVYSNTGFIYYTPDHYETFELLYDEEGKVEE